MSRWTTVTLTEWCNVKVVICFDTEDSVGMDNCIKIVYHLTKSYYKTRIAELGEVHLSKQEMIQVLKEYYKRHKYHDHEQYEREKALYEDEAEIPWTVRANYKLTRDFVEEVYHRKESGKGFLFWSI